MSRSTGGVKTDTLHSQDQDSFNVILKEALKPSYRQHLHGRGSGRISLTMGCDVKHVPSLFASEVMHVFMRVSSQAEFY